MEQQRTAKQKLGGKPTAPATIGAGEPLYAPTAPRKIKTEDLNKALKMATDLIQAVGEQLKKHGPIGFKTDYSELEHIKPLEKNTGC